MKLCAALLTMVIAAVSFALAQTPQQYKWCEGEGNPSPDLRITSCTALIQSGNFKAIDLANIYFIRGGVYMTLGQLDRAIADYDQVIRLNPSDAEVYSNRAGIYAAKGQHDRAIADLDQAIYRPGAVIRRTVIRSLGRRAAGSIGEF